MSNIETLYYDSTWFGYHYDITINHAAKTIKYNMWISPYDLVEIYNSINSYIKDNYSNVINIGEIQFLFEDEAEFNRFYFEHA